MDLPKPFLKWAGGKRALLPELLRYSLPLQFKNYHEPFLGGGALFFALYRLGRFSEKTVILSDINKELIDTYMAVRGSVDGVIRHLQNHQYDKEYYYKVREQNPDVLSGVVKAARMIYLNRSGFNGLYRVNKQGKFNVPFGAYTNPLLCDIPNLKAVSRSLQNVTLNAASFEATKYNVETHDFVYFDPPYVPVSDTANFTTYSGGGFNLEDQQRLMKLFRSLAKQDVFVMLSNSDTPWVREHYAGYCFHEVQVQRNISAKSDKREVAQELIITNF